MPREASAAHDAVPRAAVDLTRIWVAFEACAALAGNTEFVVIAVFHVGHEPSPIPVLVGDELRVFLCGEVVEVPDDRHRDGTRRPGAERRAAVDQGRPHGRFRVNVLLGGRHARLCPCWPGAGAQAQAQEGTGPQPNFGTMRPPACAGTAPRGLPGLPLMA